MLIILIYLHSTIALITMQNYDADEELQISATNMGIPMNPDLPVLAFADNDFDNGHYGGGNIDNNSDGNGSTDEDEDTNQ